jgi:ATP synthase protein I
MLGSYAVVLRRSALITLPAALVMVALGAVFGGVKGLLGALLGAGLVAAFFGISALVVTWVGRRRPNAAMGAAAAAYVVKVLLLLFFVVRFSNTTAFNGKIFGFTAIGCILVWTAAQAVTSMRLKVPYVVPDTVRQPRTVTGTPDVGQAEPDALTVPDAEPGGER